MTERVIYLDLKKRQREKNPILCLLLVPLPKRGQMYKCGGSSHYTCTFILCFHEKKCSLLYVCSTQTFLTNLTKKEVVAKKAQFNK